MNKPTETKPQPTTEFFSGFLQVGCERVGVDFQCPINSTFEQREAAFMAALAQKATIDYLSIGTS